MKQLRRAALVVAFLGSALLRAEGLRRVDEGKAKALMVEHLKKTGRNPEEYHVSVSPFGISTWIIHCARKHLQPVSSWRHTMNSRGEIEELSVDSLNIVFMNEYPSSPEEEDRKKLITDFVSLHERDTIINGTANIPGYDKAPLDSDIAAAVREPFSFGDLVTVVYTYQRIGGVVRRYRFQFDRGIRFRRAECAVLGRGIGDAQYLE